MYDKLYGKIFIECSTSRNVLRYMMQKLSRPWEIGLARLSRGTYVIHGIRTFEQITNICVLNLLENVSFIPEIIKDVTWPLIYFQYSLIFFRNTKSTYLLNCFKPSLGIITLVYSFTFWYLSFAAYISILDVDTTPQLYTLT